MTARRYLTWNEKAAIIRSQGGECALCPKTIIGAVCGVEYDHTVPVALGNDKKPDRALCRGCHLAKTKRDVKAIAKTKRILRKNAPPNIQCRKRKIQSAGFRKDLTRHFDGSVTRRAA